MYELKTLLIILLGLFGLPNLYCAAQWNRLYLGDSLHRETGVEALEGPSGKLYLWGTRDPGPSGYADVLFQQISTTGQVKHKALLSRAYTQALEAVVYDSVSQHFFGVGKTYHPQQGTQGFLFRADSNGQVLLWQNSLIEGRYAAWNNLGLHESLLYAVGFLPKASGTSNHSLLACLDTSGKIRWYSLQCVTANCYAQDLAFKGDSLVVATDSQLTDFSYRILLSCFSTQGKLLWRSSDTNSYNSGAQDLSWRASGEVLVAGESSTAQSASFDMALWRWNQHGQFQGSDYFGTSGSDAAFCLLDSGSVLYLGGYGYNPAKGGNNLCLRRIVQGTEDTVRYFGGGPFPGIVYSIMQSRTGSLYATGFYAPQIERNQVLLSNHPNLGVHLRKPDYQANSLQLRPNPATEYAVVELPTQTSGSGPWYIQAYSLFGEPVPLRIEGAFPRYRLPVHHLSAGYYTIRVSSPTKVHEGVLLVQH